MWKIPLFDLNYDEREADAVQQVLASRWLTSGARTRAFEEAFSAYLGESVSSLAVSSCTAALHLALLALELRSGDEVIISGLTFVACLNVVQLSGAVPVLADSNSLEDWNVSAEDIRQKITPRTRAIIIVHFAGHPCDLEEIGSIAKEKGIALIEDVAHAVGASYRGRKCGSFGDIACFSFFSNKNLSTGEGGMIVTGDAKLGEKFRLLRSHGMTSPTVERHLQKVVSYDVLLPGLNYRFDEMRAAIGLVQLEKLDPANRRRGALTELYREELQTLCPELLIPWKKPSSDRLPAYHIFPVLLPEGVDRKKIMEALRVRGIQTSVHYPAFRQFSYYRPLIAQRLALAEQISQRVLTLPLYPTMTEREVHSVNAALAEALSETRLRITKEEP